MSETKVPYNPINDERGKLTEERFLQAFEEEGWRKPKWYKSIRKATGLEDSEGYDFFIETDVGELGIQVKSSRKFVQKYLTRHPESKATIIVVDQGFNAGRIRHVTLEKLARHREQFTLLRTGAWSIPKKGFDG